MFIKNNNRRGWIRIVEAFIAVLLVTGVLLIVINKGYIGRADISEQVYQVQIAVLKEIQLEDSLRTKVLSINEASLPVKWEDFEVQGLGDVKTKFNERIPEYLTCEAKVCILDAVCEQTKFIEKDVYARSIAIAADLDTYSPRQLKLFCWSA